MDENKEKVRDMNEVLWEIEMKNVEIRRKAKENSKGSVLAVVVSTIISIAIFYFMELDAYKWSIPVILVSSIISMIFLEDEKKNVTGHFFGLWLSIAAFTVLSCLVIGVILGLIYSLIQNFI
ncbi:hypothetical protein [Cytobacillus praedii]|uniref:Uncharacterized protein n=1 Tax=Cytobacillus praedii TaxID=1742358 RepID=A0A4R1AMX0_9BACI|nr:hypothetical protein [Cytobacillus praedii]TCJ00955.1 hypothetical protein E0Y62_26355 [Cytobacillus praedii]